MISTGNDIVSLNAVNVARSRLPAFYSKILSASEQALYHDPEFSAIPFENYVWLLWSIKESAFKYLQRSNPDLTFSPSKFIVQQLQIPLGYSVTHFDEKETEGTGFDSESMDAIKGTIDLGYHTLYSRSIIYKELIVTVVNGNENFENTSWGIKIINQHDHFYQSRAVREFLVNRLNSVFDVDDLMIGKNLDGFPVIMEEDKELEITVSLSHHDHLVAYSFQCAF